MRANLFKTRKPMPSSVSFYISEFLKDCHPTNAYICALVWYTETRACAFSALLARRSGQRPRNRTRASQRPQSCRAHHWAAFISVKLSKYMAAMRDISQPLPSSRTPCSIPIQIAWMPVEGEGRGKRKESKQGWGGREGARELRKHNRTEGRGRAAESLAGPTNRALNSWRVESRVRCDKSELVVCYAT